MNLLNYKVEDVLWCHWDLLRFLNEKNCDLHTKILCVGEIVGEEPNKVIIDYRIYLFKNEDNQFVIEVYMDEDNFECLIFDSMKVAFDNLDMLPYNFPQYKKRPMRILNINTLEEIIELEE